MNLVKTKVMVSKIGQITVKPSNKKDLCGICGRKIMASVVLWISCGNWIHGRRAKIKWVSTRLVIDFKCTKCKGCYINVDQKEKFHDDVDAKAAVTSRTRLGWVKFRDCQDLLYGKNPSENEMKCIQKLCEISTALWKRDMVLRPE